MERGTSVLALQSMFHNSFSVCGADLFFPVFSEAGFLLGGLIKCPGDFFNDLVGAGAELSMFVNYEGNEVEIADRFDVLVFFLFRGFFVFDGLLVVHRFHTVG